MIVAPNSPRPGVIAGFAIEPPAQICSVSFTANSTWIGVGGAPVGWSPAVGEEIAFTIADPYSGIPFLVGSVFNWRGPWAASTAYAVGDAFAWFDGGGVVRAWVVVTAFTSGSGFATSADFRQFTFRGAWATGTAYVTGDVVLAPDGAGNTQTWVANSAFTSGGSTFVSGSQWVGALAARQIFYVVAVSAGSIQISTTPTGAALTFMSTAFAGGPDTYPAINVYFGVVSFGAGTGLKPQLSLGALFAQGVLWMPSVQPAVPAAPASQYSYLAYNSTGGLYWTTNPLGTTAGDAVLGWVVTDATDILAASNQDIRVGDVTASSFAPDLGSGIVLPPEDMTPPTPIGGIASAGGGMVTWNPITFAEGDPSAITGATIVLLYQGASQAANALLTAALGATAAAGTPITLATDTDLTGVVHNGDWLLIGDEMFFVTADASSSSVACERALGLTNSDAHSIGDAVYLLSVGVFSYTFQPLFFLTTAAATWSATEILQSALIALFNIVVYSGPAESVQGPVNYSQSTGGLIPTGTAGSGALAHSTAHVTAGVADLDFTAARSIKVLLTTDATITPINVPSLPFLWVLSVNQDSAGGHSAIPGAGMSFAPGSAASPANTYSIALYYCDGAGNHLLLSSSNDQEMP